MAMDPQRRAALIASAVEAQAYPPEAAVAKAWLEENIDQYWDIDAQVRVGPGVDLGPDYSPNIQKMAAQATRKRVDLVAYDMDGAIIVELKDHVDLAAVRQAIEYGRLWNIAPIDPPLKAILVAGRTGDADIMATAARQGVTVELFPQVTV